MAYIRPGLVGRLANRLVRRWRVTPVLVVEGRTSGKAQEVPLNVLPMDDTRYLVSPRGESQWVRNLRAAGGRAELRPRKGEPEPVAATEITDDDAKPAIIDAYRKRWGGPTKAYWRALPDPADHPIFEIRRAAAPDVEHPEDSNADAAAD